MNPSTGITTLDVLCGALACFLIFRFLTGMKRLPKGLRLPPGPPGKFIIGNVTDLPKGPLWERFDQWAKTYGGLVHIKLLGKTIIIINSLDIARDLLEKRSAMYSDRVHSPLMDLMGWGWNTGAMRYGDWWRRHRRMFHQHFNLIAIVNYRDIQTKQTRQSLLQKLSDSPGDFISHIRHLTGATIMEIVYGIKVLPRSDPYLEIAEAVAAATAEAGIPGRFLVDFLPFLKYVPEWMPGADFRRKTREWKGMITSMADVPLKVVKDDLDAGTAKSSIAATLLEDLSRRTDAPTDEETVIRNVTGIAYAGGSDTTLSSLSTFILAMVLYPEVQRKAQAELDAVIGNRLPVFEDGENLPYVTAVCKEIHRWHPGFPLGFGHRVMEDDVYEEHFIPGGSLVIANSWTILRDEKVYGANIESFDPERFFRPGATDPIAQFGFGRRICAGRHLADSMIFIAVASVLKVFNISSPRDSIGNEIPVNPVYVPGLLTYPEPFLCAIKPRSESTRALLVSGG